MVDGVDFASETCVVAMVITTDGTKIPVGLRHGDTENGTLVTAVLADLVDRGLDYSGGLLVIIDGAKALASAVKKVSAARALIGRCQLHKARNVEDHLPKTERALVRQRLVEAFNHPDPDQGLANARRLASELDKAFPDVAGSIREGLEEMFTVARLGVTGRLAKTPRSTNPIESMISIARTTTGNVKRAMARCVDAGALPGCSQPNSPSAGSRATPRCRPWSLSSEPTPPASPEPLTRQNTET